MEGFAVYLMWLLVLCAMYAIYTAAVSKKSLGDNKSKGAVLITILLSALAVRLVVGFAVPGFSTDMSCWNGWASRLADTGPANFYSPDYFCDYPPGYLYILNFLGLIKEHLLPQLSGASLELFFKLPAMLFDLATIYLIYMMIAKFGAKNENFALLTAALYAFCPPIILNSAAWGQVDAIFTFFILFAIWCLLKRKLVLASVLVGLSVLFKPQALLFGPVFLYYFLDKRSFRNMNERLISLLECVVIGVAVVFVGSMPFMGLDIKGIFSLYFGTLSSYNYASVNAFNFYALFGENWTALTSTGPRVFYIPAAVFGTLAMVYGVFSGGFLYLKAKAEDLSRFFYIPAMVMLIFFTFGVKMHERYLFGVIAMLLVAFALRRDKRILALSFIVCVQHYINAAYILYSEAGAGFSSDNVVVGLTSLLCVAMCIYAVYLGHRLYFPKRETFTQPLALGQEAGFHKKGAIILCVITVVYTVFSYTNLGNTSAAQSMWKSTANTGVVYELDSPSDITRVMAYNGLGNGTINLEASGNGQDWSSIGTIDKAAGGSHQYCFTWYSVSASYPDARYVRVTPSVDGIEMIEMGIYSDDALLSGRVTSQSGAEVFDEQNLVPAQKTYMNSMYFDEIYHGRTAYEMINGVWPYEYTHPPLGKELIGIGIRLFGMTPFGWRFMGTLFGALMIPLMYAFAKKMFRRVDLALVAAALTALDFMHFEHSRISSIDIYVVFFIILAYYFMYDFYTLNIKTEKLSRIIRPLLLSGIAWGCACASKWVGIYAGAGLAIIFFVALFRQWQKGSKLYANKALKICGLCVVFFGIVPFTIYYTSFVPILRIEGSYSFWSWQERIYSYHSGLDATHPYSSTYWQWPIMYKPLWMYSNRNPDAGTSSTLSAFGNPAIWYPAIAALCLLVTLACRKVKDNRIVFLLVAFASQIVPWLGVARCTFIYHYFECIPFLTLMLCYAIGLLLTRCKKNRLWIYLGIVVLFFILYYPVLSGVVVPSRYTQMLRMFESWVL